MKWNIVFAFACLRLAYGQDPSQAVRQAATGWTHAVVSQDKAALERLLADDLYFAHSSGRSVQTKVEYIASLTRGAPGYEALTLRDITILFYDKAAVLSGYVDTKHPGSDSFPVRFLQLWVENRGQWQMAASAATRLITPGANGRGGAPAGAQQTAGNAPVASQPRADAHDNPQPAAMADPAAAGVREAASQWTQAVVKEDHAALQRLLADDLVFVHSGGGVPQTKAQYIDSPENSTYDALPLRDVAIKVYGQTAVLSAFLDTKHKGRETSPVKTLQVFRQNNGKWQLAAFQATRISPPPQNAK